MHRNSPQGKTGGGSSGDGVGSVCGGVGGSGTAPSPVNCAHGGGSKRRVCVIGAGVIGLGTAVRVLEESKRWPGLSPWGAEVTVIADRFSPHTTSDGSGGFWAPFETGDTPAPLIRKWGDSTWQHIYDLAMSGDGTAGEVGAQFVSGYQMTDAPSIKEPVYKDRFLNFRLMTPRELELFPPARSGYFCTSLQINVQKYLPWLMKRFKDAGGKTEFGTVERLSEVADEYDVVVNCCGPRAGQLMSDPHTHPIRGQLRRVRAPWIKHFYIMDSVDRSLLSYILPLGEETVVGGVVQVGNWNEKVDKADSEKIWRDAQTVFPFLKNAQTLTEWTGLRPGRTSVRLEADHVTSSTGRPVPVVHNYGHGGAGISLHWGCAADASDLVRSALSCGPPTPSSKL